MKSEELKSYFLNGFLLIIPVLIWNWVLADKLPDSFLYESSSYTWFSIAENIFRTAFFVLAFLIPLKNKYHLRHLGWWLYGMGLLLYFISWIILIVKNNEDKNLILFLLPSVTPVIWMSGIIFTADNFNFGFPYKRWILMVVMILFLLFHNLQTLIIFYRL